jgi:uncharacterized membrane protein HdeD (DUF308 family)
MFDDFCKEDKSMIKIISKYWWVLTLRGIIAMAFGLVILLRPAMTLYEMVLLFSLFAFLDSVLTFFAALGRGEEKGEWSLLLEGSAGFAFFVLIFVASNIGSMLWPRLAAVMLVYYMAGWAIATGFFKTITAFLLRKEVKGERILGLGGMVSILAGVILIFQADSGVLAVARPIGIFAVVLGILLFFSRSEVPGEQNRALLIVPEPSVSFAECNRC